MVIRSNYDKPFYVDVGTSLVKIMCASNHDVIFSKDHHGWKASIELAERDCERMNKEFELYAKLKAEATKPTCYWSVKDALAFANTLANHGWTRGANADVASSCIYALCRMLKECGNTIEVCMKQMCDRCRAAAELDGLEVPCVVGCETLRMAKEALDEPLRNCDVGTAGEQTKRYDVYCYDHRNMENCCGDCPLKQAAVCEIAFGQIPYEVQEGDAE